MEKEGKCDFEVPKLVAHRPYRLVYSERVCGSKLANWRKLAQLFEQSISAFVSPRVVVINDQLERVGGRKFFIYSDVKSRYYPILVSPTSLL